MGTPKFEAVTKAQLVERLGRQCSPMALREGYVIGPDIEGHICHCSTHNTLAEAQKRAEKLNNPNNKQG